MEPRTFITVHTSHLSLFWARLIQYTHFRPISGSVLISLPVIPGSKPDRVDGSMYVWMNYLLIY